MGRQQVRGGTIENVKNSTDGQEPVDVVTGHSGKKRRKEQNGKTKEQ